MSPSRRLTTQDTKHKSQNTKLESQKFETQNSKHPYTKHNVPYRLPYVSFPGVFLGTVCSLVVMFERFGTHVDIPGVRVGFSGAHFVIFVCFWNNCVFGLSILIWGCC